MIDDPSEFSRYAHISWEKIDEVKFHTYGAGLFTLHSAAFYPISVVKTRIQVGVKESVHTNSLRVFRGILRDGGVRGLYRGFATAACSVPIKNKCSAVMEMSKEFTSKLLAGVNLPDGTKTAVANGVGGFAYSLTSQLFMPLDVVTQRLMVQGLPGVKKYSGGMNAFLTILRTDGISGLYRGLVISTATHCPSQAVWWGIYGTSQHAIWKSLGYTDDGQHPGQVLIISVQAAGGVIAGAASSVITTPIDTIKTRLQVMDSKGHKPTIRRTVKELINEDAWKGFYRGLGPRFLSMSLTGTSSIVLYEYLKRLSVKPTQQ